MKINNTQQAETLLKSLIPNDIKLLSDIFLNNNLQLFLVGGAVRDVFFNKTPKDFDVCTNALPDTIIDILTQNNIKCQLQGEAFGVVVAKMDSEDIEIATFRIDVSANTGKNNDDKVILGVTIEDDVKRRDLTCNALFFDLHMNTIIDLVGGIDDIKNNVIRAVGDASIRFMEDNLRLLRAIRFSSRLGFKIDNDTFDAIKNIKSLNIASERIVTELQNIFNTTIDLQKTIDLLFDTELIFKMFPNCNINSNIDINKISSFDTFIACLLDTDSKTLNSLKFSAKTINAIELLKMNDIHTICPIQFTSKLKSTNLSCFEICTFHQNDIFKFLFNFKFDSNFTQRLMDKGFKGKDLGVFLKKIARRRFDNFIKKH